MDTCEGDKGCSGSLVRVRELYSERVGSSLGFSLELLLGSVDDPAVASRKGIFCLQ